MSKRETYDMAATTAIYVDDGSEEDATGDEYRAWYVTPGDDDGEPTGKPIPCSSYDSAFALATDLAAKFGGVEVVTDAWTGS